MSETGIVLAPKAELAPPTPMTILQLAVERGADIDTIERLAALQKQMLDRDSEISFNEAMNLVQQELTPVAVDLENPQTRSKYASYKALDNRIRPLYTKHGFSISYNSGESTKPEHIRVFAYVSHSAGHTRTYQADMPADGKGAKGGDVMTKTHAAGAAMSYGMRYLLKLIFNIAVGEDDNDGNGEIPQWVDDALSAIESASTEDELFKVFKAAYTQATSAKDKRAMDAFIKAKDARKKAL